ncbi:MAG: hypothetical protein MUC64_13975 [Rubritepida sp.]|jgi:hypothetical protein|nr:hypothetical protein [Rubritepida sp.]
MSESIPTNGATDGEGAARARHARSRRPRPLRGALACLALPLLGGCYSDISGVRDWSIQAREAVLPVAAIRTATVPAPAPTPAAPPTRSDAVLVLQDAAGAWLATLAAIADDSAPTEDGATLEARAAVVAPFDPAGAAAVTNLARAVGYASRGAWRASGFVYAFDHGAASFHAVMSALDRQLAALQAEAPPDAEGEGAPVRVDAARRAAIARVAAGHEALAARQAVMTQSDTGRFMRAEASELRRLLAAGGTGAAAAPRGTP